GQWHAGSLLDSSGSDAYQTAASPRRPVPFNLTRRGQEGFLDDHRTSPVPRGPRAACARRLPASPRRLFFRPVMTMSTNGSRQVMDGQAIQRSVVRIAHEVVERNRGTESLALIGIRSRGVYLAQRLRRALQEIVGGALIPFGVVDITLYRDDLDRGLQTPRVQATDIVFPVDGAASCWSTPSSSPAARPAPPWTRWSTSAARSRSSSRCWSTAAIASCPSAPTTLARTSPRHGPSACRSGW